MDIEAEINTLIGEAIASIEHSVARELPSCWFRTSIEEPAGREPTAADVRLSWSREVTRTHFGSVTPSRNWLEARLTLEGLPIAISFPFRTGDDGLPCGDRYYVPSCKATLLEWFELHRPNKKFPLDTNNPALQFKRAEFVVVHSRAQDAEWTKPARVVAACNEWLTRFGYPTLDTARGNALLAAIDELLTTNRATCAWVTDDISDVYHRNDKGDVPYTSCMSGGELEWFALYDHMQARGSLSMVEITRNEEHVGRVLVWHGSNPDDLYMDRVYAAPYRDSFEPDVVRALKEFCKKHDIRKCVYPQTAERLGLEYIGGFSIDAGADPTYFVAYPYLDSLRFFGGDGRLRMNNSHGGLCLDQTDGGHNGDDYIELENGDRVPEEDARHSDLFGGWYHCDHVTYSNHHDDYIPDDEVLTLHNGVVTYRENDDVVELHDGEWAFVDDAVGLHDGNFALNNDAVELHDGDFALDDDAFELHDGSYALWDDTVELQDGRRALRDDVVEQEDGSYTLQEGPEPEPEPEPATTVPQPQPAVTAPRAMPADLPPVPDGYDYVGKGPLFERRDGGRMLFDHPTGHLAAIAYQEDGWDVGWPLNGMSPNMHYAAKRGTEVHQQLLG
jgi:hypothetical protein